MARRFINFGQTPISSGVEEVPLDILLGKAQDIQKQSDTFLTGFADTFKPIQGGYATQDQAEAANKKIKQYAEELTNKFSQPTQDAATLTPSLLNYRKKLLEDPDYQSALTDYKYRSTFDINHPKANAAGDILHYIDKTTGKVKQNPVGTLINPALYYNTTPYADYRKLTQENIKNMAAIISSNTGEDIKNLILDPNTGNLYSVSSTGEYKLKNEYMPDYIQAIQSASGNLLDTATPEGRFFVEGSKAQVIPDFKQYYNDYRKVMMANNPKLNLPEYNDNNAQALGYVLSEFPKFRVQESKTATTYNKEANALEIEKDKLALENAKEEKERISIPSTITKIATPEDFKKVVADNQTNTLANRNKFVKELYRGDSGFTKYYFDHPDEFKGDLKLQHTAALNKLKDPNLPAGERIRYEKIVAAGNSYFDSLKQQALYKNQYTDALKQALKSDNTDYIYPVLLVDNTTGKNISSNTQLKKEDFIKMLKSSNSVINPEKQTISYNGKTYHLPAYITDKALDYTIKDSGNMESPIYSVTTGTGKDTGTVEALKKAVEVNRGNNRMMFEGQNPEQDGAYEFISDKLGLSGDQGFKVYNVSVDKLGNTYTTYLGDNGKQTTVKMAADPYFEGHRKTIYADLRKTKDTKARDFGNMGLFNEFIKNSGSYADWVNLISQSTGTIEIPNLGKVQKLENKAGDTYYEVTGPDGVKLNNPLYSEDAVENYFGSELDEND